MPSHRPRATRAGRAGGAVVVLGVLALVAAACARPTDAASATSPVRPASGVAPPAPPRSGPTPTTTSSDPAAATNGFPADWSPPPVRWTPCAVATNGECATLTVPLDWSEPSGRTTDLALGRIPATGARIGSLLVNPGGPGGSGLEFLSSDPLSSRVAGRFDIVSWDPRGVGASSPLSCGAGTVGPFLAADPDPDTAAEESTLEALADRVARDCARADPELLSHMGTDDVARDLEAIRRALGDGPLNYVGFSYGTQIGQQYAQYFPTRIRSMVLDGVVNPSLGFTDFLLGQLTGFDRAFQASARACRSAGPRRCGVADLGAAYDRVKATVEATPLPAGDGRTVGPAVLAVAATYVAYGGAGWQELGPALAQAVDSGDGSDLWELAQGYYDLGGYTAYAAVVCRDTPPPVDPTAWKVFADEARARSPRFGGSVANELLPCATWPVRSTEVPAAITADGAPPILVVGNTGDPATPYGNAVAVAGDLASGVLVTADIGGHTAYGRNRCVTGVVDIYLIDLTVPPTDPNCR